MHRNPDLNRTRKDCRVERQLRTDCSSVSSSVSSSLSWPAVRLSDARRGEARQGDATRPVWRRVHLSLSPSHIPYQVQNAYSLHPLLLSLCFYPSSSPWEKNQEGVQSLLRAEHGTWNVENPQTPILMYTLQR